MSDKTIEAYLTGEDWRVKENANSSGITISGLKSHVVGDVFAKHALSLLPEQAKVAHETGVLHIHDLRGGIHSAYCCGHDLRELLMKGVGIPTGVRSKPARHLDVAVDHIGQYLQILSNEHEGAQAFSSTDTLLAPFIYHDNLSQKDVNQCMQRLIYGLNFESRQAFQCVTEDTEVLTPDGFKTCETLNIGDNIYTWDNGEMNIQEVLAVNVKDYDGEMHVYSNNTYQQVVTPNHKVLRAIQKPGNYKLIESSKLIDHKSPIFMPVAMRNNPTLDYEISDEMLTLAVIVLTDGNIRDKSRIVVTKSPLRYGNELIVDILDELGYTYSHSVRNGDWGNLLNKYYISKESSKEVLDLLDYDRTRIPKWFTLLSKRQAQLVIDIWSSFDGHFGTMRLQCDNEFIQDSLQHIAFLAGHGSRKHIKHFKANANDKVTTNAYDVLYVKVYKSTTKSANNNYKINYKGKVWCPSTDDGIVVYRKNGNIFISGNSPFSNLSFDWTVPDDLKDTPCIIGGELQSYTYASMQEYMDMINIGFLTNMLEGDSNKHPFTFPIPTYAVRDESMFEEYDTKTNLLWELTAKYGSPYFSNYLGSGINPYTIRSLCCRLSLDLAEVANATSGIWDYGAKTGSLSVVTVNANRAALDADSSRIAYLVNLENAIELAKDVLLIRKGYILDAFEGGLMPYSKEYIGRLDSFFLTLGIVGVYDAWINLNDGSEYDEFAIDTLETVAAQVKGFSTSTDWKLWNFEQTPMESGAFRLAKLDKAYDPDCKIGGDDTAGGIYLTNSTHVPVDNMMSMYDELEFRGRSDRMYSGGTLYNHFTNEHTSAQSIRELIHTLCTSTKLPYIAFTPTFGVCPTHGLKYKSAWCDECDEELTIFSRVIGYYRSVQKFNDGQFEQFTRRKYRT